MREFERDGSGSSHRREATHTYHERLDSCGSVGTRLWDGDITLGLLSSPGCAVARPLKRSRDGAERSVQMTDSSFHDWSHGDWRLIRVDTQLSKS